MSDISLEELIEGMDASKLSALRTLLKADAPAGKPRSAVMHGTVKRYISVDMHVVCMHCGDERIVHRQFEPKYVVLATQEDGSVKQVIVKEPCVIHTYTKACDHCVSVVSRMDRKELEERYICLLKGEVYHGREEE